MLLDSSVFIRWARQGINPASILKPYHRKSDLMTCAVVRVEVLRGFKQPGVKDEALTLFSTLDEIPVTAKVWDDTVSLAWTLDRRGRIIPLPDLIIAACGLEADVPLVTFDTHFDVVPGLTVYSDLP